MIDLRSKIDPCHLYTTGQAAAPKVFSKRLICGTGGHLTEMLPDGKTIPYRDQSLKPKAAAA